jgi:hypothetical protein
LPIAVFVVAKKILAGLRIFSGDEFLLGMAIAGAKAPFLSSACFGTSKLVPCYKTTPTAFFRKP